MVVDEDVEKLTFQGKEGFVTILPNHIDYVSSFDTNIMNFVDINGNKKFVALNNGILVKYSDRVRLTAYKVIMANSLNELKEKINDANINEEDIEKEINKNLKQLEYYMFNNLVNMKWI